MTSLKANYKLGFLGAGQLARMSALQAFQFGIKIASFSDHKEDEPLDFMTPFSYMGSFEKADDMVEFASTCDLVTLENEFIGTDILINVREQSGTAIYPTPETFALIENKLIEKQTFEKAGIPVTPYKLVTSKLDMNDFGDLHGWPYLLKSSKGGYDGYGNKTVHNPDEALQAFNQLGGNDGREILAEAFVEFEKELAVQIARNETGTVAYPVVETIQENHICVAVLAPATIGDDIAKKVRELAITATEAIDGKGIFAYEFFLTKNGEVLLNESAPRPHNSGHYTIEGCVTSQFENHVRAVMGLPLGSAELVQPAAVMINLLGTHKRDAQVDHMTSSLAARDGHLHIYGKLQSKPGRKMGHFTLLGDNLKEAYSQALELTKTIHI
ncbi:MAG: 5-(carboxyamino)imidazole ribonucleotide synthase [Bacteroidota bacterium]